MQIPTPASSAKTFRTAARRALAGRWSDALTWLAVLTLICGGLFGAGFTFNQAEDTVNPAVYWRLQAQIGPYYSVSYWQDGEMVLDAAENASAPGLVACTPAFLAAALTLAIVFLLLQPVAHLGQIRLSARIVQGENINAGILRTSLRTYFRYIGANILMMLRVIWLPLLVMLGCVIVAFILPVLSGIATFLMVFGFLALLFMRVLYYVPLAHLMVLRPEWTAKMLLKQCRMLMTGRRRQLLILLLSFTGWFILAFVGGMALQYGLLTINNSETGAFVSSVVTVLAMLPVLVYGQTALHIFVRTCLESDPAVIKEETEHCEA